MVYAYGQTTDEPFIIALFDTFFSIRIKKLIAKKRE